ISSKQTEQVPEEKKDWGERDEQRVSHLRGQTRCIVSRGLPDQAPKNSPSHAKHFHANESLLCRPEISINFQPLRPAQDRQSDHEKSFDSHRRLWRGS